VQQHTFNAAGQEVASLDANGHPSATVFDGAGRRVRTSRGVGTEAEGTRFTYDALGNVLTTKSLRATGEAFDVAYSYDDLSRRVLKEDGTHHVTTRAYDEAGHLVCLKKPLGGTPLTAAGLPGLTVAQEREAVCTGGYLTRLGYDEEGEEVSMEVSLGADAATVPTENLKRDMTISRSARIRDIGVIPGKVEPPHGEQDG
jgi:YD repeat-containing protein